MSSTREQIPPRRKRQHIETGLSLDKAQPSKRLKSNKTEFYDSLSKIWLTRRALKEYPAPAVVDPTRAITSSISSQGKQTKSTAPTSTSPKTTRSSAYDKDFEQHYIDNHIYPEGYDYRRCSTPEPGLEGFEQKLSQPRRSLSPSRFPASTFRDFKRKNATVVSEGKVMGIVFPIISSDADIPNEMNLRFTRLESMTSSLTIDPRPDFYDGARLGDIDKEVREELGPYIIPTGHIMAPVAPNFFTEAKAPSGGADVAKRQAMQDGAYGARAMHSLQSYSEGRPVYDGNAYTVTSTYHAGTGTLKLYTTHVTAGSENTTEYHMTQIKGWDLTSDYDTFRQGAAAFRNARDWAKGQRDALITAANERARSTNPEPTRTERMIYPDWLATLDEAQEPPASRQLPS